MAKEQGVVSDAVSIALAVSISEDELMRPPPGPNGEMLVVNVRFAVFSIKQLDTAALSAGLKIAVVWYWTDPRMIGWDMDTPVPDKLWGPDMFIVNRQPGDWTSEQTQFELADPKTGRMKRAIVHAGVLDNDMALADFPFDYDDVQMHMETISHWSTYDQSRMGARTSGQSYSVRQVTERFEGKVVALYWNTYIPEWELLGCSVGIKQLDPSPLGSVRTMVDLRFHVARKWRFYFWKVIAPLMMLGVLAFKVFERDVTDIGGRNGDVATYFLAAFAMLFVVSSMLPFTDYQTRLDYFVTVTVFLIVVIGLEATVANQISKDDQDWAETIDFIALISFISLYVLSFLIIFAPALMKHRAVRQKLLTHVSELPVGEGADLPGVPKSSFYLSVPSLKGKGKPNLTPTRSLSMHRTEKGAISA